MEKQPFRLGLTGSIGMGKSTTARLFAEEGAPVWDADAAVHRLYGQGGTGVPAIAAQFPAAIVAGAVDRTRLRNLIAEDPSRLSAIEAIIHPLVAEDRRRFAADHRNHSVIVFDIPLLFETGSEAWFDAVAVVSAPPETQRERVLGRPGMTPAHFEEIRSRQIPDAEKRRRADFVIMTDRGIAPARSAVREILREINGRMKDRTDA